MNIHLNLATRPYIELRSVYARLRVFAVGLAVLALPMLLVVHLEETKARLAQAHVTQLEGNIALLRREQTRARALAVEGPNANVLNQAAFLNDLFRRKAFSWTATMSDLEDTLPYGVQVQTSEPVVARDGRVTIRMRVLGARERAVEVVRNLEHSRHFVAPRLVTEALANQGANAPQQRLPVNLPGGIPGMTHQSDVAFDILAGYRPLPNSHDNAGEQAAKRADTRAEKTGRPAHALSHGASTHAQLTNPDASPELRTDAQAEAQSEARTEIQGAARRRHPQHPLVKPFAGVPAAGSPRTSPLGASSKGVPR